MLRIWNTKRSKILTVLTALLLLYAVSGFFILPLILKSVLESELNSKLNAKIEIGSVSVNPFALSISINQFKSFDDNQNSLLTFDKFYINFECRSLVELAPTFSLISLENPNVRIGRRLDGKFNLANLIKKTEEPVPESENKSEQGIPEAVFDKIEIVAGNVLYFDEQKNSEFNFELIPLKLSLLDFGTEAGKGAKITFETSNNKINEFSFDGDFSVNPLKADGLINLKIKEPGPVIKYLLKSINIAPVRAEIDLEAELKFDGSSKDSNLILQTNKFDIRNAEIKDSEEKNLLILPSFSTNINFNLKDQLLKVSDLKASSAQFFVSQDKDGKFNFATLQSSDVVKAKEVPAPAEQKQNGFGVYVEKVKLDDFKVSFNTPSDSLLLNSISLSLDEYDSRKSGQVKAQLSASLSEGGAIKTGLDGELSPPRLQSDFSFSKINLNQFSPWLYKSLKVTQQSGTLDADINLKFDKQINAEGKLNINDFSLLSSVKASPLIAWKKAAISKFNWSSDNNQLQIEGLDIANPDLAMKIDSTGSFVFTESASTDSSPDKQPETQDSSAKFSYKIKNIKIGQGQLAFKDESTKPNYNIKFINLNGNLKNLDSSFKQPMSLSLKSDLSPEGRISYEGEVAPSSSFIFQNAKLTLANLNLVSLSPYSAKFIGRGIDAGKLFAELESKVKGEEINGLNKITLDNFYLGSVINSEASTILPISTALSIMRDGQGKIVLDLPISGNVKSVGVSYRSLLYNSFENLILEVIASPMNVLASLYNINSEEFSHVDFKPLSSEIGTEEAKKLDVIKKALSDKVELKLEIRGRVAAGLDTSAEAKDWDDPLRDLARARAEAVKNYILRGAAISEERIFTVAPEIVSESQEKLVATTLKLVS